MKMAPQVTVVALLALAGADGVEAQSLKVRQRMAAQEKSLLKDVAISNKICGSLRSAISLRSCWKWKNRTCRFRMSRPYTS